MTTEPPLCHDDRTTIISRRHNHNPVTTAEPQSCHDDRTTILSRRQNHNLVTTTEPPSYHDDRTTILSRRQNPNRVTTTVARYDRRQTGVNETQNRKTLKSKCAVFLWSRLYFVRNFRKNHRLPSGALTRLGLKCLCRLARNRLRVTSVNDDDTRETSVVGLFRQSVQLCRVDAMGNYLVKSQSCAFHAYATAAPIIPSLAT